jgi:putative endopeptidase
MGFGVGQLYSAKYFPAEAKKKIQDLVTNLKAAYRARIEKLDWMGPETKKEALKKLDTYTIKVGYPDHPRDYSKLVVRDDDLIGNVKRSAQLDWDFYTGRFSKPVDRTAWSMTPQTNDAYNGSLRDIVFPAGILQPPIFDADADPAINYGAAGGVIGHELTHGFDDQGRKIDASGALRDWWTKKDADEFQARAKILKIRTYSRRPSERRINNGRKHCGPGRPHTRARRLSRFAQRKTGAGARWLYRRSARPPRMGAGLARKSHRRLR